MILADSCIWIDFLSGRADHGMARALFDNRVAVCGMILAEVLSGVRKPKQRAQLERRLGALPYLEQTRDVHLLAARIYADLQSKGTTIPLSDCIIAATCLHNSLPLLSTDKHFDSVTDLQRA